MFDFADYGLEIKSVSESGTFEGYASVFGNVDEGGDVIAPGAFAESIAERMPAMLWQHDPREPIGVYTDIAEDRKGLRVAGELITDTREGDRAHKLLRKKAINGLSIGYVVTDAEPHPKRRGVRLIKSVDLWEVSLVTFPMNQRARVTAVKSKFDHGETPSIREMERFLRYAVGMTGHQARQFCADGFKGLSHRDGMTAIGDDEHTREADSLTNAVRAIKAATETATVESLRRSLASYRYGGRTDV